MTRFCSPQCGQARTVATSREQLLPFTPGAAQIATVPCVHRSLGNCEFWELQKLPGTCIIACLKD